MIRFLWFLLAVVALAACTNQDQAAEQAQITASDRNYYVMKNDVEYQNYDRRLRLADDPTTILWCTSAFANPSSPMFTVAIVGKLTSGGKRPFDTAIGPDAMYGTSGEYRYGFTPSGVYNDFYNLSTFCTTEPMVWQREQTTIILATNPKLLAAQEQAKKLLADGKPDEAQAVLEAALR